MAMGNIVNSSPLLPGKKTSPITDTPPKPPALKVHIKPDKAQAAATAKSESELVDPKSTGELLATIGKNALTTVPILIKKYWWIMLILAGLWLFLMTFNPLLWSRNNPSLAWLFNAINPLVMLLIFLTAAWNNWIAKSIYVVIIFKVIMPLAMRIKKEGFGTVLNSFKAVIPSIKQNWQECNTKALPLFVSFLGAGLLVTNFLSRNNSFDKCFVSVALAISLVKVLSDGEKSPAFMAFRVISKDIFKLFKKDSPVRNHHVYICFSGLMTGLAGALILFIIRAITGDGIGQFIGYYLGSIAIITGITLNILKGKLPQTA
jgi:hypothetical protein